jgi:hypothetical protein
MTTLEMDPVFTEALRGVLAKTVDESSRVRRRWRWRLGASMFAGLVLVGGGVALAAGVFSPPGAPIDTQLGNFVSATRTGTATIDLGPRPATANDLSLKLTCVSVGTFTFPNGSNLSCDATDVSNSQIFRTASEVVPLSPGVDSVTITTRANASWTLQVAYVNQVATSWGVNASGQTFGVQNQQGTPDLLAVVINQGATHGYVESSELNCAAGGDVQTPAEALTWDKVSANRSVSIPVYESNGTTVIGTFVVGDASQFVPLSSLSLGC